MSKRIIYIAHPVSGDVEVNIKKIGFIYRRLSLENKVVPCVPYIATLLSLDDDSAIERQIGISHNIAMFKSKVFDEVWLYGDRISAGMQQEIELAESLGIPVVSKTEGTKR